MKKLYLLCATLLVSLSFNSCLNSDSTTSPVVPGTEIYTYAKMQAYSDLDPLVVALKLNCLIETADSLGVDYKVAEVVVSEAEEGDGDDDGSKEKKVKVVEQLFGDNTVTNTGSKWTITYAEKEKIENENSARTGTIIIETNGHYLTGLSGADARWEITTDADGYTYSPLGVQVKNKFEYYYIEAGATPGNSWKISAKSAAVYSAKNVEYKAATDISYDLENRGGRKFFYNEILSALFYLTGTSQGATVAGLDVEYSASDLKYKPACSTYDIFGGTEYVTADRNTLPLENFPSNTVSYKWFDAGACESNLEISYNGITVSY